MTDIIVVVSSIQVMMSVQVMMMIPVVQSRMISSPSPNDDVRRIGRTTVRIPTVCEWDSYNRIRTRDCTRNAVSSSSL